MKALVLTAPSKLKPLDRTDAVARDDEAVRRARCDAIRGSDLHVRPVYVPARLGSAVPFAQ